MDCSSELNRIPSSSPPSLCPPPSLLPPCPSGCYPSSHPLNQLQTRRTHSSLPASRTLDQLSSRPAALSNLPGGSKTNYFPTKNGSTMAGGRGDQSTATSLDTFMALRSSRLGVKRGSDRVGKDSAGPERKKGVLQIEVAIGPARSRAMARVRVRAGRK